MPKSDTIIAIAMIVLLSISVAYLSVKCGKMKDQIGVKEKLQEQIEIKDAKIMELQTKLADYARIYRWIPILDQTLPPLTKMYLDVVAEKLEQDKAKAMKIK